MHLCRFHHRLVHEGGYTLDRVGREGRLCFRKPGGRVIPDAPPIGPVRGLSLERRNRRSGLALHPDTCTSRWTGERLDLALSVDALVTSDVRLLE